MLLRFTELSLSVARLLDASPVGAAAAAGGCSAGAMVLGALLAFWCAGNAAYRRPLCSAKPVWAALILLLLLDVGLLLSLGLSASGGVLYLPSEAVVPLLIRYGIFAAGILLTGFLFQAAIRGSRARRAAAAPAPNIPAQPAAAPTEEAPAKEDAPAPQTDAPLQCAGCGTPVKPGTAFCTECGRRLL